MPRKPTWIARQAKARLIGMVAEMPRGDFLPTLEILGKEFQLHPSTVFRMLRDLGSEGVVWQGPNGRFYPAASRFERVRGLPVCFIGRKMWHWSRLYHEILEGVSEVCAANGSPLLLLSAPSLVSQSDPTRPPRFASSKTQMAELEMLLPSVPRNCGGILFDHLWKDAALSLRGMPSAPKLQLCHGSGRTMPVGAPNEEASVHCAREFVAANKIEKTLIVSPFRGDPAIDASVKLLKKRLAGYSAREVPFAALKGNLGRLASGKERICLVCPEDNTAWAISTELQSLPAHRNILLLAIQGTGLLNSPVNRLRFDFRRLGRSCASTLLHGTDCKPVSPGLIEGASG